MAHRVVFSPEAEAQLDAIYDHIRPASGDARAHDVVLQLTLACRRLDHFPQRGVIRDDLRPGVRVLGYRRWASIVFAVEPLTVTILAVFWRGRDLMAFFDHDG